jgi:pyruvate dehydrogenase kinase 2/3/4
MSVSASRAALRRLPKPPTSPPTPPLPPSPPRVSAAPPPPPRAAAPQAQALPPLSVSIASRARQTATPLTVRDLRQIATRPDALAARLDSARWLHGELPIRLAHRVAELRELPYGLAGMPSVVKVRDMYTRSFHDIAGAPLPASLADAYNFSNTLGLVRDRHEDVVKLIARGVLELKASTGRCSSDMEIRSFLDRFYMSRISIRVLLSHHLALGPGNARPGHAGIINQQCSPASLAQDAIDATRSLAYAHYGEAPTVHLLGNVDFRFPYIEKHVFMCLFELLKNAMRATVEQHRDSASLPPIRVMIAGGVEDVTIKISDEGGGFRRSEMDRVWSWLGTTATLTAEQLLNLEDDHRSSLSNRPDPIAGFGYGLPLSRLFARYFGGDLSLTSMEGLGTDAYLHLSALGDREECLL